jgi:hypothetical protein
MGKTILYVHGSSWKPPQEVLRDLWLEAIRWALQRDRPDALPAFEAAQHEFVYHGDLSNKLLSQRCQCKPPDTTAERRETLEQLQRYARDEFTRESYLDLPRESPLVEVVVDVTAPVIWAFHTGDSIIRWVSRDSFEYWDPDSSFGSEVRQRMSPPLMRAFRRGDQVMVVAHSLGTVISYDTFWKFSHTGEYRPEFTDRKIDVWLTLGSPLGEGLVKRQLRGAEAMGIRRYPANVLDWINVAAADDFIAHDKRISDDFQAMIDLGTIRSIQDATIYNLAMRSGKAHPHSALGYLIHPVVADVVASWLES